MSFWTRLLLGHRQLPSRPQYPRPHRTRLLFYLTVALHTRKLFINHGPTSTKQSWSTISRYAPTDACTAIYGGVSGAQYDSSLGQWVVPCDAEIDMALQIECVPPFFLNSMSVDMLSSNQIFPIHPLDVTPTALGDPNTCVGSFIPQSVSVGSGQLSVFRIYTA